MADREIAGVKVPAGEGFLARVRIFQVTLHDDVAAKHDFADALAVARHRYHGFGVHDHELLEHRVTHALARLDLGLLRDRQRVPLLVPGADDGRAVHLGQAVDVGHVEIHARHRLEDRRRRRRGRGHDPDPVLDTLLQRVGGVDHQVQHDRRAAEMGNAMFADGVVDIVGAHRAQAHAGAVQRGDGPREAPAVAVEHRQRPQVDRVRVHVPGEHVRNRV